MRTPYGLLSAVRKYPIGSADPFENFLTEAWAWSLRWDDELCSLFLAWVTNDLVSDQEPLEVTTQRNVPSGFIDLMVETKEFIVIFEHKTWSAFGDEQVEKYHADVAIQFPEKNIVCATITGYPYLPPAQPQIVSFARTWGNLAQWLKSLTENDGVLESPDKQFVIRNLIELIEQEGLGMKKALNTEALKVFYTFSDLEPSLKQLFVNIRETQNWEKYSSLVKRSDEQNRPRSVRQRWGRVGIEMSRPEDWKPGLFFGVLLSTQDHLTEPSNTEKGPDLCLIVDLDSSVQGLFKKPVALQASEYKRFANDLAALADKIGWNFYDHLASPGKQKNYWHPLYLRQPLTDCLKEAASFEEQQARINTAMQTVFDALLEMPSYFSLVQKMSQK